MNETPTSPTLSTNPAAKRKKKSGCLKALLIGVVILIGLIGLFFVLGAFASRTTNKMVAAAEPFFQTIKSGDVAEAYKMTSESFQETYSLEEFTKFAADTKLTDYASGEWHYRSAGEAGDEAIEGHIVTASGEEIPLMIAFLASENEKVISAIKCLILSPAPKSETDPETPPAIPGTVPPPKGSVESADGKKILFSFSTAKIENPRLTMDPEKGTGLGEEFPDNAAGIYFQGNLASAMDGTEITANWYNLDLDKSNPMVGKTLHGGSPQLVTFSLIRTADMLPAGQYRLDVVIAGKVKNSFDFRIREATHEELKASADAGNASDAFRIFLVHVSDEQSPFTDEVAVGYLAKAAEGGHPQAQYNLGVLYDQGNFLPKDPVSATKWFRQAASRGNTAAQLNLVQIYRASAASPIEIEEAIGWTKGSAESGDPRAQYAMGIYALTGTGMEQNSTLAIGLLEQAAEKDATIAFLIGDLFEKGKDLPQDLEKAKQWYQSASERGEPNATAAIQRLSAGAP